MRAWWQRFRHERGVRAVLALPFELRFRLACRLLGLKPPEVIMCCSCCAQPMLPDWKSRPIPRTDPLSAEHIKHHGNIDWRPQTCEHYQRFRTTRGGPFAPTVIHAELIEDAAAR